MTSAETPDPSELHAYVDGELSPERAAEIERLLAEHPDLREEVDGWIEQKALLKDALEAAVASSAPGGRFARNRSRRASALQLVAASLVFLAIGLVGGFAGRGALDRSNGDERMISEALAAHAVFAADPRRPVELGGDERVLLDRWLSKRVGHALSAPDMTTAGFEFLGGRLIEIETHPAALFVYRDADGRRLSLVVTAPDDDAPPASEMGRRVESANNLNGFYWRHDNLRYVMAAANPSQELEALARSYIH